jgi:hypothetical protein
MRQLLVEDATFLKSVVHWACHPPDPELQTIALWTLKNLTYRAEVSVKQTIMRILSYASWLHLTDSENSTVLVQVWTLVRNLVHTLHPTQYVGDWSVKELCAFITQQLQTANTSLTQSDDNRQHLHKTEVWTQILYVYANLLAVLPFDLWESFNIQPSATLARVVPLLTHSNAPLSLQVLDTTSFP